VENFIIRFTNEEVMKKWSAAVDNQRKECNERSDLSASSESAANFAWMRDQAALLPNPYAQQDDDDDDEYTSISAPVSAPLPSAPYPGQPSFGMSRNASSTSLRSRSTTGESTQSLASIARAPPPRFPMGFQNPPLSLQTQLQPQSSPSQRGGDSYFSPVAESPASSPIYRTCHATRTISGLAVNAIQFPRQ
jgi:cell division control protein 24